MAKVYIYIYSVRRLHIFCESSPDGDHCRRNSVFCWSYKFCPWKVDFHSFYFQKRKEGRIKALHSTTIVMKITTLPYYITGPKLIQFNSTKKKILFKIKLFQIFFL